MIQKIILAPFNFIFKIIDNHTAYDINNYTVKSEFQEILDLISNVDTNNLSIKEAYDFIDKIKNMANALSH